MAAWQSAKDHGTGKRRWWRFPRLRSASKPGAEWLAARFVEAGLSKVETDAVGNVCGMLPATNLPAESTGPVLVLSAHIDTVFPADTPLNPVLEGDRLAAPGACDNGAGVVGHAGHCLRVEPGEGRTAGNASLLGMWAKKAKETCGACAISTTRDCWLAASLPISCWMEQVRTRRDAGPGQPTLYGH